MNLSLDEYRALVAKAFRGVGYPWGLTEDASWAARRLAEVDASSPAVVVALLDRLNLDDTGAETLSRMPSADWTCAADALCSVCVGTALVDLGVSAVAEPLLLGPTLAPEFLAPFLVEVLTLHPSPDHSFAIDWGSGRATVSATTIVFAGERNQVATTVTIRSNNGSEQEPHNGSEANTRVILQTHQIQRLERYAQRIYAPATDASRAGAGAGTSDND